MAITKAPLLSMGASGKLGKTLVASKWHGIKTMREYVVPANPRTPAQEAQRAIMRNAITAWQTYVTSETLKSFWNALAGASGKPQSGANAATSSMCKQQRANAESAFTGMVVRCWAGTTKTGLSVVNTSTAGSLQAPMICSAFVPTTEGYTATLAEVGGTGTQSATGTVDLSAYAYVKLTLQDPTTSAEYDISGIAAL